MSTEIEAVTESAKAVQETGKAVGKALDLIRDIGPFVNRVLGKPIEDMVGLTIADPLHEIRRRNQDRLAQRTDEILRARLTGHTEPVSPDLAIPLIAAAQDQSRPELQELWARLLANAMDPYRAGDLRQEFIETIRLFHPKDALFLQTISDNDSKLSPNTREFLKQNFSLQESTVLVGLAQLEKLGCIHQNAASGGTPANFYVSVYGVELMRACRP
jgi:Abortive infection alpha